jgi:hypothetical protein
MRSFLVSRHAPTQIVYDFAESRFVQEDEVCASGSPQRTEIRYRAREMAASLGLLSAVPAERGCRPAPVFPASVSLRQVYSVSVRSF